MILGIIWRAICIAGVVINASIVIALMGTGQWERSLFHFIMVLFLLPGIKGDE